MNKKKFNVAVLFGGSSAERDVSIASGIQVIKGLRTNGHNVLAIDTQRGLLSLEEEKNIFSSTILPLPPGTDSLAVVRHGATSLFASPLFSQVDVVFLALHGGSGENGTIQALLDLSNYAYTGSGHAGSALAMDKDMTKRLITAAGIPTPDWFMIPKDFNNFKEIENRFGFPLVVKANQQGSSIGVSIVKKEADLAAAIESARHYDPEVMIEKFILGRELTVGILHDKPLSVGEIIVKGEGTFDYANKYQPDHVTEIFPADIPKNIEEHAKELTLKAHQALKLSGYSRADFRLDSEGNLWFLEINTLPGMTTASLLPQSAKACGISFTELCEQICELAIAKKERKMDQKNPDSLAH